MTLRYNSSMNREGTAPDFSKHLGDEIDEIGTGVFTGLQTEYGIPTETEEIDSNQTRDRLIELLNRLVAPSTYDRHLNEQDSNTAKALLEQMGYPISSYDSLLGTHSTALVADKLIEARGDSL